MKVTNDKNCYCHTCDKKFHYLGIARHRTMHRDKKQECVITYTNGDTYTWKYSEQEDMNMAIIKYDLVEHLRDQQEFSEKTFGPGARTQGVLDHIRKELIEIEAEPDDLEEWIDVVMLALDGAWRAGYTPEDVAQALRDKLIKNKNRDWPDYRDAEPGKAIEHNRG